MEYVATPKPRRQHRVLSVVAALVGIIVLYLVIQITALILHVIGTSELHEPSSRPIGTHPANTDAPMRLGTDVNFIAWAVLLVGVIYIVVRLRKRSNHPRVR